MRTHDSLYSMVPVTYNTTVSILSRIYYIHNLNDCSKLQSTSRSIRTIDSRFRIIHDLVSTRVEARRISAKDRVLVRDQKPQPYCIYPLNNRGGSFSNESNNPAIGENFW